MMPLHYSGYTHNLGISGYNFSIISHWGLYKMTAILQTFAVSNAFCIENFVIHMSLKLVPWGTADDLELVHR